MEVDDVRTSLIINDHYGLKIESKRLISGNFQVKFFALLKQKKTFLWLRFGRCGLYLERSCFENKK